MTNNTDKPMELRELPVNPCNNCENPNQMSDKRCGNCRFNAGVNYAIKSIVPQAIQATREETRIDTIHDTWVDMQELVAMFGNKEMGRAVDAYKNKALKDYRDSLTNKSENK